MSDLVGIRPADLPLPTLRDERLQEGFDRDGIVVVPLLDAAAARSLRTRVLDVLPDDPGEFFDLFRNNPPAQRKKIDYFVRSELEGIAETLLIDHDFWSTAVIVKPPGPEGEIGLHTDWTMVDEQRFRSGLIWLALDDATVENGSIVAVPGTHCLDVPYRGRDIHFAYDAPGVAALIEDRTVQVDVPLGHAAVWDNRLLHGSGPNHTASWRIVVALGFKPRAAELCHYRRQPNGVSRRHTVQREFYLDYEPFDPDFQPSGPHVSAGELVPLSTWEMTPEILTDLGSRHAIRRSGTLPAAPRPVVSPTRHQERAVSVSADVGHADLVWIDLSAPEVDQHQTALADIAARRLDGLTVSDVFAPTECANAVKRMERFRDQMYPAIFGTMLGVSLADLAQISEDLSDRTAYLDRAQETSSLYLEAFGFDPYERLAGIVGPLGGGLTVTSPSEGGRRYPPANVRWMEPGGGGLPAHVGNEFQVQSDASSEHLRRVTRIRDHYSWFVVLQTPEEGGDLSVFDLVYEAHTPVDGQWGGKGRNDADFDHVPALRIAPSAGTLVMFGGGWRWHRVDKVLGDRPRVTYGGFAGPSTDGRELHFWF